MLGEERELMEERDRGEEWGGTDERRSRGRGDKERGAVKDRNQEEQWSGGEERKGGRRRHRLVVFH